MPAWKKIPLVGLLALSVGLFTEAEIFRALGLNKCPGNDVMLSHEQLPRKFLCFLRCRQNSDCSGVCYKEDTGSCRVFTNLEIGKALEQAVDDNGSIMWWTDYPKNFKNPYLKLFEALEGEYTYEAAVQSCRDLNRNLVAPKSKEENDLILAFMAGEKGWIGINDIAKEGEFVYEEDGSPLKFTNWREGSPKDDDTYNCVKYLSDGSWNDFICDKSERVVCAYEIDGCDKVGAHYLCFSGDLD